MKSSDEIREAFLSFFQERGHTRLPSSSLIPRADPTLLFANAGMNQFKDVFLGVEERPYKRATTSQKCVRAGGKHNDLDNVGRTARHHTFFEMLGNFSFGDYFKREAIGYAWEFLTDKKYMGLAKERLWVTIYENDDEAFRLWQEIAEMPAERIVRLGEHDNFWAMGDTGPCGPCSEIIFDQGEESASADCSASGGCAIGKCDCDRWLELWNLVFMQYNRSAGGGLTPLPKPSIDTGMGLERLAAVLQGVSSNYDTDLLRPIIARVEELSGVPYSPGPDISGFPHRVIADHARACAFLIADGVLPSNEGRGYVLRRILRRAVRLGRKLELNEPFLGKAAEAVIERMKRAYTELSERREFILRVLDLEEERFGQTLTVGINLLENELIPTHKDVLGIVSTWAQQLREVFNNKTPEDWHIYVSAPNNEAYVGLIGLWIATGPLPIRGVPHWLCGQLAQPVCDILDDQRVAIENELSEAVQSAMRDRNQVNLSDRVTSELAAQRSRALRPQLENRIQEVVDVAESVGRTITGRELFVLYDTYGFPYELTEEIAAEHGLIVDRAGFEQELAAQRERSRAAQSAGGGGAGEVATLPIPETEFLGYTTTSARGRIVSLAVKGAEGEGEPAEEAHEGQEVEVVLDRTPFYGEMGGQVGDTGELIGSSGRLEITEAIHSARGGLTVHKGRVVRGSIFSGEEVTASVDAARRFHIARNHTATHLLHAALRKVLGNHVQQAGSLVAPDRLRFDFSHIGPVSKDDLAQVQALVNEKIRQNWAVSPIITSYNEAIQQGALAFFDEKYGETVRMVQVRQSASGDRIWGEVDDTEVFSRELCGGTHVAATGEIGMCLIIAETGIGAGMRRIEAVTGQGADELIQRRFSAMETMSKELQTNPEDLSGKVEVLVAELDQEKKKAQGLQRELAKRTVEDLMKRVEHVDGVAVLAARVDDVRDMETIREMADWLRDRMGSGVVALGIAHEGRANLLVAVTKDLVAKGFHAGDLVKAIAQVVGGSGGGRADLAQAGGRDIAKLDEALQQVKSLIKTVSP